MPNIDSTDSTDSTDSIDSTDSTYSINNKQKQSILDINSFNSVVKGNFDIDIDTGVSDIKSNKSNTSNEQHNNIIATTNADETFENLTDIPNIIEDNEDTGNILSGGSGITKKNTVLIKKADLNANKHINKDSTSTTTPPSIPHLFTIDYLLTSDKDLINEDNVYSTVDTYISNYNSEQMKTYNQSFKNLYQKYSRKQYIIKNISNKITVIKNTFENIKKDRAKDKDKDTYKNKHKDHKDHNKHHHTHDRHKHNNNSSSSRDMPDEIIFELTKPHYLFYDNNNNLTLLKTQISNKRVALQFEYQNLINKINVELPEKKQFEKQRIQFIELLETYYTYVLYHKKINQILINNKTPIIVQSLNNMYSEKPLLEGSLTYIDNSYIELINKYNTDKLNKYNELIIKMRSTHTQDDALLNDIKEYINKSELIDINNTIREQTTNQVETTIINYIITNLP